MNSQFISKLKKLKALFCTIVIALFCFAFVACNSEDSRDMDYYILPTSNYSLITGYDTFNTITSEFVKEDHVFRQYDKITINLSSEWLYSSKIETLSFAITTNKTTELQLKVTVTNLKGGDYINSLDVKNKNYTIYKTFYANSTSSEEILVNDIFELAAAQTCIIIELENTEIYTNDNFTINDLAFSVNNLYISGQHVYL